MGIGAAEHVGTALRVGDLDLSQEFLSLFIIPRLQGSDFHILSSNQYYLGTEKTPPVPKDRGRSNAVPPLFTMPSQA